MTRRLQSAATFIALAFCVTALRADIAVPPMRRLPGSSLDTSVRNEADRAIRQAARWLADRQQADGSWGGESNRVQHTSLALSALAALAAANQPDPEYSDTIARAAVWLGGTETNRLDTLGDHAWRLIALSLAVPELPARQQLLRRLAEQAAHTKENASADDLQLWREARNQARIHPTPLPVYDCAIGVRAQVICEWSKPLADNLAAWRLAHLINYADTSPFMNDGTPIDWRTHIAERLINSQKSDPRGGGYWPAGTPDRQLAETAYGLLSLLEL